MPTSTISLPPTYSPQDRERIPFFNIIYFIIDMNVSNKDRIFKIFLGRPAGGRLLPACLQLSLIYAWHLFLSFALVFNQGWLSRLNEHAQRFWFRHGLSIGVSNHETSSYPNISVLLWYQFNTCLILVLSEALVMWIIFRLAIRRPRPKWNHFIRYWWKTCLYSTFIPIIMEILSVVLPSQLFISTFFDLSPTSLLLLLIGLCFLFMPAVLSCREVSKRAIHISPLCPICKYWLHMLSSNICPECGTLLCKSNNGGYIIDREKTNIHKGSLHLSVFRRKRKYLILGIIVAFGIFLLITFILNSSMLLRRSEAVLLHTTSGPVEYSKCLLCNSVRLKKADGTYECPVTNAQFDHCNHMWLGIIDAWSTKRINIGDVILIRKGKSYNAIKIVSISKGGNSIVYDWYYQPDTSKGTFNDVAVQKGTISAIGKIQFKQVDIKFQNRRIWYDLYFGGIDGTTQYFDDPHYIAFAGKMDISKIDATDPMWIYETWDNGKTSD